MLYKITNYLLPHVPSVPVAIDLAIQNERARANT